MKNKFEMVHITKLRKNDYNIRQFEEFASPQRQARFDELVLSIRAVGILEPLVVRPVGVEYEIIAGERRYRAAMIAKLTDIPCMIRDVDDATAFDLMVIENLQRDDLTPVETAMAFKAYLDKHGNSVESVADLSLRTGIPAHAIRRLVRLLDLPTEVIKAWRDGSISQSHADMFTRIGDAGQAAELLSVCLRMKLSTRELAERIGAVATDLDKGFFDKDECSVCGYNTSVQSGLFSDLTPGGKCGNPACFEVKQSDFLTANWPQSKAAQMFGTCGFCFGHRLGQDYRTVPEGLQTVTRCLGCEMFVSVLRLTGAVVSGYSRTCTGPRACHDELYLERPSVDLEPAEKLEEEAASPPPAPVPAEKKTTPVPAKPAPKKQEPPETGPVFDLARGERSRKLFVKGALMEMAGDVIPLRLVLLALALQSSTARLLLSEYGIPTNAVAAKVAETIFDINADDLPSALARAATVSIMTDSAMDPGVWKYVANRLSVDVATGWRFSDSYLAGLNRSEIIRVGEEPGVGIWVDPAAEAYRKERYAGKALMSLKKEDLIDIILNSGAELAGRVPAEVLGKKA